MQKEKGKDRQKGEGSSGRGSEGQKQGGSETPSEKGREGREVLRGTCGASQICTSELRLG